MPAMKALCLQKTVPRASPAISCTQATVTGRSPLTANASTADAVQLSKDLREIIAAVKRETAELSVFQRAWVARTFQQRAGLTVDDWLRTAEELSSVALDELLLHR